jgi:hypothetical protein
MSKFVSPETILESEVARLRAKHHVHDAAWIITDAEPYFDRSQRAAYSAILQTLAEVEKGLALLERDLSEIGRESNGTKLAGPSQRPIGSSEFEP